MIRANGKSILTFYTTQTQVKMSKNDDKSKQNNFKIKNSEEQNKKKKKYYESNKESRKSAQKTSLLLYEEPGILESSEFSEKVYNITQEDIKKNVTIDAANKLYKLKLEELGPYCIDYTRNGMDLLLGGKKGHLSSISWKTGKLNCEVFLNEPIRAVKFLHNNNYFAVAQKKYTFIYDGSGIELHRMSNHIDITSLDFLPYHFLLVTGGRTGYLKYHDVTTGVLSAELRTKTGPIQCMKQNPSNAVMHLGHLNGSVTLWSPSMSIPLAKIQSSKGPITDLAITRDGKYLAVGDLTKKIKIWDLRKFTSLYTYDTMIYPSSLNFSETSMLSVSWGSHVTVWKDIVLKKQTHPYMNHLINSSRVVASKFVPYEDILGIGHEKGFESIIIPGAGEPNFDFFESNPYETTKQKQRKEVSMLINKLHPDTISLNPNLIGSVNTNLKTDSFESINSDKKIGVKLNIKSKNSNIRKYLRKKRKNVIDQRKVKLQKNLEIEKKLRSMKKKTPNSEDHLDTAFSRFK